MKYSYWSLGMGCRGMFYGILFSAVIVVVAYLGIKWLC